MESNILETKQVIKNATDAIVSEINGIKRAINQHDVERFELLLNNDWSYYEHKYFNEYKFEKKILSITGYFNYDELYEEVNDYVKAYTWYSAWKAYIDGDL